MSAAIYILVGRDGIRYVGQTRRTPQKRYACHSYDARRYRDLHVYRWWRSLPEPPRLVVIERCHVDQLNDRESFWIAAFRAAGADLCNLTTGGDTATTVSEETRRRLSASLKGRPSPTRGMKMGPETRAKISAIHKGRKLSTTQRENIGAALKVSEKAIAQRSANAAAQIGRKRSPAARARMAEAQQKRYAQMSEDERKALTAKANSVWRARARA